MNIVLKNKIDKALQYKPGGRFRVNTPNDTQIRDAWGLDKTIDVATIISLYDVIDIMDNKITLQSEGIIDVTETEKELETKINTTCDAMIKRLEGNVA